MMHGPLNVRSLHLSKKMSGALSQLFEGRFLYVTENVGESVTVRTGARNEVWGTKGRTIF
jgi:hypothetical protein